MSHVKGGTTKHHGGLAHLRLRRIGFVRSDFVEPGIRDREKKISEIQIDPRWLPALKGIEEFSHVIVFFYFSRSRGLPLQVHPRKRSDLPLVGLFATRSPHRPNPIAMTICRLIRRRGSRLWVRGLDALDGTPILDLKPYIPANDAVKSPRLPAWVKKLD